VNQLKEVTGLDTDRNVILTFDGRVIEIFGATSTASIRYHCKDPLLEIVWEEAQGALSRMWKGGAEGGCMARFKYDTSQMGRAVAKGNRIFEVALVIYPEQVPLVQDILSDIRAAQTGA
jgi:hypothetical protein